MQYFIYDDLLTICELGIPGDCVIEYLGNATLSDYRLTFRKYANIEYAPGESVQGALICIGDSEFIKQLDFAEKCPWFYTKRNRIVHCKGKIHAMIYTQKFTKQLPKQSPDPEYLSELYTLYLQYGLPLNQINDALALDKIRN